MAEYAPSILQLAALRAQFMDEANYQRRVLWARAYHDGATGTQLTDRLREFLGNNADNFRLNLCRTVVSAVTEKLSVESINDSTAASDQGSELADWLWEQWTLGRLDEMQDEIYEAVVRDGEAFLLLDWSDDEQRVTFTPHPRYTSPEVSALTSGDGFGCKAKYEQDDPNQTLLYVSKYWTEYDERMRPVSRRNDYYPDRIGKFVFGKGGWLPYAPEPEVAWVDAAGQPLGIPAAHFRNVADAPEAMDAWPVQDAINKLFLDMLADADVSVFRLLVAFGWYPTTDGKELKSDMSNALRLKPGVIVGSSAKPDAASLTAIEGGNVESLMNAIDKLIVWLAMVTDTPLGRFQLKLQVRSSDTLDAEEEPLNVKIEKRQVRFGNAWQRVFALAARIAVTFGNVALPDGAAVPVWKPVRKIDPMTPYLVGDAQQKLGIPLEFIWANTLGFTQTQIDAIKNTDEYKAHLAFQQMGLQLGANQQQANA